MNRMWVGGLVAVAMLGTACSNQKPLFRSESEFGGTTKAAPLVVQAKVTRDAQLRSSPDKLAPVRHEIAAGTAVTAAEKPMLGYRRVQTADGKSGFVEEKALELGAAQAQQGAPSAAPAGAAQ